MKSPLWSLPILLAINSPLLLVVSWCSSCCCCCCCCWLLQEDGRQEAVALPSASFSWAAQDVSVFSSGSSLQLPAPDGGPSRLLRVTEGGKATAMGLQETERGLDLITGRAVVVCRDTRIEEKQQADISVVLPTALRLLYESTEALFSQPLGKQAAAAAAAAGASSSHSSSTGAATAAAATAATAQKALLLRQLLLAEEPHEAGKQGEVLASLPPLRLSAPPKGQQRSGGGVGLLYLVQGKEYLFRAELFSSLSEIRGGRSPISGEEERKVLLPSNAVLHWACEGPRGTFIEGDGNVPLCPLEKSVTSQQV